MLNALQSLILAAYPPGSRVIDNQSYQPGYLPYPARVTVQSPDGTQASCVLTVRAKPEAASREVRVLGALAELGLAVPTVLAGPVTVQERGCSAVLVSELPGKPLPWLGLTNLDDAHLTCQLVQEAVDVLHTLTGLISEHEIGGLLPRYTLLAELNAICERPGPEADLPMYRDAIDLLNAILPGITTPLVFSNGDYNPLNFLRTGRTLTGWLDFENACFEDPIIGFAKFFLWAGDDYGWGAGIKAALVERYLYVHNVAPIEFLPRLVLRGLRHLQECARAAPQNAFAAEETMLGVVADAVARLKRTYV